MHLPDKYFYQTLNFRHFSMLSKFNISMSEKYLIRLNTNEMFYILSCVWIVILLIEKENFNLEKVFMLMKKICRRSQDFCFCC